MAFFRQVIAPFLILLVFLVALVAVSIRSFLPADMAAPAPIEETVPDVTSVKTEATSPDPLKHDPPVSNAGNLEASS